MLWKVQEETQRECLIWCVSWIHSTGLNSVRKSAVECRDGIEAKESVRPEFECLTHHKGVG